MRSQCPSKLNFRPVFVLYSFTLTPGTPSPTNLYLFNGDFVDRGEDDVSVMLIIYALKLSLPKHVFINR